jgi:hypothetical protein
MKRKIKNGERTKMSKTKVLSVKTISECTSWAARTSSAMPVQGAESR